MMTLLIAENNPRDQQFCRDALEGIEDSQLLFFEDGAQALRRIADKADPVHLVIALWELPGEVSGAEMLILSRRSCPDLPVILISARWDLPTIGKALGTGAF